MSRQSGLRATAFCLTLIIPTQPKPSLPGPQDPAPALEKSVVLSTYLVGAE